jgi:hypothetical protein
MIYMAKDRICSPPLQEDSCPDCTPGTGNPISFIVPKPSSWKQGHIVSIRTDGKDLEPGTL